MSTDFITRFGLTVYPQPINDDKRTYVLPAQAQKVTSNLWVITQQRGIILEFAFLAAITSGDEDVECEMLMHGEGPLGNLKECRHTYWGEEGYIFYPDATHIRAMLDWLEAQGYEL